MGLYRRRDYKDKAKSRVWWICYQAGGRQHRESTFTTNKKVAERIFSLRKARAVEERWNLPRSRSPRLGQWIDECLKSVSHDKTRSRYRSSTNNLLRYYGEKVRLHEMSPESVFRFQQTRLEEGAGKATVNRDVATLSSMMSRARKMRLISQNPCSDVGRLNERRERRQAKPLSYDEEARIKQFAPPWLSVLTTLLVETGLRVRKEALHLKWADVCLDTPPAYIHVRDSKSVAGLRTVWLTRYCCNELLRWRAMTGPEYSPYLFPSPQIPGRHITDYKGTWRRAAKKAGVPDRVPYDLRSTFASRANSCRASSLTVAHLLGHQSTQILPTYVKPLDENTRAVIDAFDQARISHLVASSQVNRDTTR